MVAGSRTGAARERWASAPLASDEPLPVMNDLHPLPRHVAQQLLASPTLPTYHSTSPDKDLRRC